MLETNRAHRGMVTPPHHLAVRAGLRDPAAGLGDRLTAG